MKQLSIAKVFVSTLFLMSFFVWQVVHGAEKPAPTPPKYIAQLDTLIANPTANTDLLEAKLVIDKLIDPSVDVMAIRTEISKMVDDINGMIQANATDWDKVTVLRQYIYESGEWNNFKPFSYDLNDPQGDSRTSRLLHNYLKTRKGNCVSMPILHAILGQKIGLDMKLSTAPLHMFVIYTNEQGQAINIEATSGGHPARDEWYQKNLPMLPAAIKNGMFMKPLTPQETIAVMGHDLANHLTKSGNQEDAILVSEKLISLFPNYAPLYLSRGSAFYKIVETDFKAKYPQEKDIPLDLKPKLQYLLKQNMVSFKIAEELGWRDPDELAKSQAAK